MFVIVSEYDAAFFSAILLAPFQQFCCFIARLVERKKIETKIKKVSELREKKIDCISRSLYIESVGGLV